MDNNIIVYGVSSSYSKAQNTIATLKQAGFLDSDLLVLSVSSADSKLFANENHINTTDENEARTYSGAAIGGFIGWLAMAGFGIITIPIIGYFIVVTPVLAAMIGAGIAGSINGVKEVFHRLGMSDDEVVDYELSLNQGKIFLLVSISNEELIGKAEEILQITQMEKIHTKYNINSLEIDKLTAKKIDVDYQINQEVE